METITNRCFDSFEGVIGCDFSSLNRERELSKLLPKLDPNFMDFRVLNRKEEISSGTLRFFLIMTCLFIVSF